MATATISPGARPLAQYVNANKTHTVSLHENAMRVDSHYAYQTIQNVVPYNNVARAELVSGEGLADPRYTTLRISTNNKQIYEIPNLETIHAQKIKNAIESNKVTERQKSETSARAGAAPVLIRRF